MSSTTPGSSRWSEFRERGGLWVAAQLALMAGITAALFLPPDWPETVRRPLRIVGILLVLIGAVVVVWAYRSLGRSFTPFTRPPLSAARVEAGPYRRAPPPLCGRGGRLLSRVVVCLFRGRRRS